MGQLGFFDLNRRYESLDEKNDPLVAIAAMVPFESFRSKLKAALIKGELRTSDATLMRTGRHLLLQRVPAIYFISDGLAKISPVRRLRRIFLPSGHRHAEQQRGLHFM
jgi:hypothetical protein